MFLLSKDSTDYPDLNSVGWQTELDRIISDKSQKTTDPKNRRYRFVFDGTKLMWVLASSGEDSDGEWTDVRKLNVTDYIREALSSDNVEEYRIGQKLSEFYNRMATYRASTASTARNAFEAIIARDAAEAILPFLIGTDRVLDDDGDEKSVKAEQPVIYITVDGDHLTAYSNITTDLPGCGGVDECCVEFDGKTYWVIHPDEAQRQVLLAVLKNREYPLAAVGKLLALSEKVKDIITVDVTSLEKLSGCTPVRGEGRIVLRMHADRSDRQRHVYDIEAQAEPLRGSKYRYAPNEGPILFVDNGYIVTRDLQAEQDAYDKLNAFLNTITGKKQNINCPQSLLSLLEFVHDNPDKYEMEWPDGEKIKFGGTVSNSTWQTFVSTGTLSNWFDVVGNVTLPNKVIPIQQLIECAENTPEGEEYVKVGENEYVKMTGDLKKQLAELGRLGCMIGGQFRVPKYFVGNIASIVKEGDSAFNELLGKVEAAYGTSYEVPSELNGTLRPYQKDGFEWICRLSSWGAGACLADDMGLGKTIQTIAFLLRRASKGPSLVIAPTSVVANWRNEIGNFAPTLRPVILNNVPDRGKAIENAGPNDVFLASYGVLSSSEELKGRRWNVLCLDEAHQIKNRLTKASESAMSLEADARLILTGTPLQNNISELWNLMQFINPGLLGPYETFAKKYSGIMKRSAGDPEGAIDAEAMEKLKALVRPFILRRTKEEVIKELPVKTGFDYMVQLTDEELGEIEKMREKMMEFYLTMPPTEKMKFFFGDLGRLRRAACSMKMDNPDWEGETSKIRELRYLLSGIADGENSIVIFSQYVEFLSEVKELLTGMNIGYLYMDGQTPMEQRERIIKDFQDGVCNVFVCSLKTGGVGINLTRANYVILTDPWWNPAIEQQAMDRAYRIGQQRNVTVIRMISFHTVEERVTDLQALKQDLSDNLLKGSSQTASLSYEDIKLMLTAF